MTQPFGDVPPSGIPPEYDHITWETRGSRPDQRAVQPAPQPQPQRQSQSLWAGVSRPLRLGTIAIVAGVLALTAAALSGRYGWWVLVGVLVVCGATLIGIRLRKSTSGVSAVTRAKRSKLEAKIWARHSREVPGGTVIDAPGQDRWRFSTALAAIEAEAGNVPSGERARLLEEARTVAIGASTLLRDAPRLGQARLKVFPVARFGRLDLTPDDSVVDGAGTTYQRLLDDAERQLHDLADALSDLGTAPDMSQSDVTRLHALVSLAELDADPTTRGANLP